MKKLYMCIVDIENVLDRKPCKVLDVKEELSI